MDNSYCLVVNVKLIKHVSRSIMNLFHIMCLAKGLISLVPKKKTSELLLQNIGGPYTGLCISTCNS